MKKEKDVLTLDFDDLSNIQDCRLQSLRDKLTRECEKREWELILKDVPKQLKKPNSPDHLKKILDKYILDVAKNKIDSREKFYQDVFEDALYMYYGSTFSWLFNTTRTEEYY